MFNVQKACISPPTSTLPSPNIVGRAVANYVDCNECCAIDTCNKKLSWSVVMLSYVNKSVFTILVCVFQGYNGCAVGNAKANAKTEIEKIKVSFVFSFSAKG